MVGELITLPLRLTGAATRLWWRAADQAVGLASGAAGYVIDRVTPADQPARQKQPSSQSVSSASQGLAEPASEARAEPTVRTQPTRPREPRPDTAPKQPAHVSEDPELVAEFAEPGAEEGAGPELHIREPWDGYRDMSAGEITTRLADADTSELAAVQLYESSHRGRQKILSAVEHQLRTKPSGHATQPSRTNGHGS
jgi:hypothetical protein